MCGIAGIVNILGEPVDRAILKGMADSLEHRGPDDEGFFLNHNSVIGHFPSGKEKICNPSDVDANGQHIKVGLAHRRLSIIDISSGQQPLANEDKTIWIVFNGEIYNYKILRQELLSKGHQFQTQSDTEVIVHAYEEWGERCPEKLRGMFAFAIWDETKQTLFAARDRLGIKPLYYGWDKNNTFLFGSELKAIVSAKKSTPRINNQALSDYFSLLYIPAPKTIFDGIHKLLPGHSLTLSREGKVSCREYWDVVFHPVSNLTEEEWCRKIYEKLKEAVEIRLMSEVPLGAFLSGGIDSSAVVGLMAELTGDSVKTCSIGFHESNYSELEYARMVSGRFKTSHFERIVSPNTVQALDALSFNFDEPFADSSALPTFFVSKIARERVVVCLSGDGGDENFAGYRRYKLDHAENQLRRLLPSWLGTNCFGTIAAIYPKLDWAPRFLRAKTTLTNLSLPPLESYFNTMSWFQGVSKELLSNEVRRDLSGYSSFSVFEQYRDRCPEDSLSAVQYLDIKTYLCDDILTKVDRASMAHSLEVRVPLLDHEFVELAATIPSSLKLKNGEGKYVFKKSLAPLLPKEVLYRKKMGFSLPLAKWFRENELGPLFQHTVLATNARLSDLVSQQTVASLWAAHQSGQRDWSPELWALLMLEKWLRKWQ